MIDVHLAAAMERGEADIRTRTRIEMGGEVGYLTLTPTATSEGSHGRSRDGALAGERGEGRRESSACPNASHREREPGERRRRKSRRGRRACWTPMTEGDPPGEDTQRESRREERERERVPGSRSPTQSWAREGISDRRKVEDGVAQAGDRAVTVAGEHRRREGERELQR